MEKYSKRERKFFLIDNFLNKSRLPVDRIIIFIFLLYLIDLLFISNIYNSSQLRVQDIASVLSFPCIIYLIRKINKKIDVKYLIISIAFYFAYLAISNSIFYLNQNIDNRFVFYILKEFEFILAMAVTFFIFLYYRRIGYKIMNIFLGINIIFGLTQLISGQISYYGIGSIISLEPAASGLIYFTCTILYFAQFLEKKIYIYLLLSIVSIILTIFTISKTNILGLFIFFLTFVSISLSIKMLKRTINMKRKNLIMFFLSIYGVVIVLIIIKLNYTKLISGNILVNKLIFRFLKGTDSFLYRINKSEFFYDTFIGNSVIKTLFGGGGKGVPEFFLNTNSLAVDNQFVRAIIEMGLIGTVLWLIMLLVLVTIFSNALKKVDTTKYFAMFIALFICYLAMGFGFEVFQTTRSGMSFWIITGFLLAHTKSYTSIEYIK